MNFVFQINESVVLDRDKRFKYPAHRHDSLAHRDLAFFVLKVREVFHVHVEQAGASFANSLHHVGAGANCVPDIDATTDSWIHPFHRTENVQRRMPQLILGSVIVNRDANVVLLYKVFNSWKYFRRGIAGDNDPDSCAFAVFEFASNVRVFIFMK